MYKSFLCRNGKQLLETASPQVYARYDGKPQQLHKIDMIEDELGFCATFDAHVCTKGVFVQSDPPFKTRKVMITGPPLNQQEDPQA